ncbi:Glyoxalase [Xenorhabdus nematophila ATCC 19061]|uniref:Bleomycin resistance protein n=2 Tax=Xenorhabdus nematophila TaxID=628 RepID=D3VAX2_XENNA|nr:VOC family protein [Xenorhabdus nematophila]AAL79622.1 glyoxalase [Xenorhabdus nematophila]CBJ91747.1 Glyoxalase [Xenorhabdus nematophila ATCC 19061]
MVPELTVTDFVASLDFYQRILGFGILIRRGNPDFVYLGLGEAQLMLEALHDSGWNTGELNKPLGRGINLQIEVDDVTPILTNLEINGITLYRPLKDNYYWIGDTQACQREFLVQDPDGYLLRFSQYIDHKQD